MIRDFQVESPVFSAPLIPGRKSLIQQYYKLSRWASLPLVLLVMVLLVIFYDRLSTPWWWIVAFGLPLNFILIHYITARLLAVADQKRWHRHKMCIGKETLTIFTQAQQIETFEWSDLENVEWYFSGYERAFLPQPPNFHGAKNSLQATYRNRELVYVFRLVSPAHYRRFFNLLEQWYGEQRNFEEYNVSSGLPVRSFMLEVD